MDKKTQLQFEINTQKVVQDELNQLKKTAKVYRKQQNSDIFFLSSIEQEMADSKKTLEKLQQEYASMEEEQKESSEEEQDEDASQKERDK